MSDRYDEYESALVTRYAGREMRRLFSARERALIWRDLWIWLAEGERELGLPITEAQIAALKSAREELDFPAIAHYEARFRHDVMAHLHAFGDKAGDARAILHLGATACYITDNADSILLRRALSLVEGRLLRALEALAGFAARHARLPALSYTHFQPAQPTTFGKRACLWLQDFVDDLARIRATREAIPFLGCKGTTGTQASFLALFQGDAHRCETLDRRIADRAGFSQPIAVAGQTYPRKADFHLLATLAGVAISASRMAHDVRLLSGLGEVSEPFGGEQVGSSAMAYKRNPMRSERICALSRHVLALVPEAGVTAATQWLERTLDDSASRRIVLPEAFLAADAILRLVENVAGGLTVHESVAQARLKREMPFLATEEILMRGVGAGGDRQDLHERLRRHSLAARERLLEGAPENDLLERLAGDEAFGALDLDLADLQAPERFTGLAARQTERFLAEVVKPLLGSPARRSRPAREDLRV